MSRYAVVNLSNNIVENIVEWDGNLETWAPSQGYVAVELTEELTATIGDHFTNGQFVHPPPPPSNLTWGQKLVATLVENGHLTAQQADEIAPE